MFLIKIILYFSASFFILNIPFNGHPLFYSLEKAAAPLTTKLFSFMKSHSEDSINRTKKLFTNTIPPKKDSVKIKKSGTKKPMGKYTDEEQEFLKEILKRANH